MNRTVLLGLFVIASASACSNDEYVRSLQAAQAAAALSLAESVAVAEAETGGGAGIRAALLVGAAPLYSIDAAASAQVVGVRIDVADGEVLEVREKGGYVDDCPNSISLVDALEIAEVEAGGDAVAAVPDDDVACALEIQVLSGDTLWEVKVAGDGEVLEREESDETGAGDDD